MDRITLCDYIASQNPKGAIAILNESGMAYERPSSKKELATLLKQYLAKGGENALHRLANEHPDKDLLSANTFTSFSGAVDELLDKPKDNNLNASGGGCGCGGGTYSAFACQGCGMLSANGMGGCGCPCPCRRCQGGGSMMNFNGGVGEKVSVTNVLLAVGVIALLYYVATNKK